MVLITFVFHLHIISFNDSSAEPEMVAHCCTTRIVKKRELVNFREKMWREARVHGHESYNNDKKNLSATFFATGSSFS